jgi:hypothetical protein
MQFSWHAPYEGWLQDYIVEIGPEHFEQKPAFKRAAARWGLGGFNVDA